MGRSLAPIAEAPGTAGTGTDGVTTFEAQRSQFTIERRGGREIHRETRRDDQGRTLAEVEAEIAFALGSGRRGVSYLIERDGRLYQSPISWYARKNRFDVSPGYERKNLHFDRPIEPECLFCHANGAAPVPLSVNRYQPPIFRGHAIGCERCHGPGELHVQGQQVANGRDLTIVNPRHLEPALRQAVCEQCHVLADHRVDRPGRETFDFRPGLPTSAFFAVFNRTGPTGNKAVGHVEQMKASRCYRASEGRLGCTSCHDPHQLPAPQERLDYYRRKCLDCHDQRGCTVPEPARRKQSPGDSCIDCHMPVTSSVDIVHIATTDHRILRSPENEEVVPPASLRTGSPLRLLNDDGTRSAGIKALSRELGLALTFEGEGLPDSPRVRQLGYLALAYLDTALAERPGDLLAQRSRAKALALLRRHKEALQLDESVVKSAPSYEQALDECVQNAIEIQDHRTALPFAERSVTLNPWSAGLRERLAYLRVQVQDYGGAVHEAREALRLNPFLTFARKFLIECLIQQHDLKAAEQEFDILLGLNPADRDSLGRWFAKLQNGSRRQALR
jgi:hypothetical protein